MTHHDIPINIFRLSVIFRSHCPCSRPDGDHFRSRLSLHESRWWFAYSGVVYTFSTGGQGLSEGEVLCGDAALLSVVLRYYFNIIFHSLSEGCLCAVLISQAINTPLVCAANRTL